MNIDFNATEATLSPAYGRIFNVSASGVEESEILDHFTIEEVIKHFGDAELLASIGVDRAVEYFGLE